MISFIMIAKNIANNLSKLKKKKVNFRQFLIKNSKFNQSKITRLSYDLQSGSYIKIHREIMKNKKKRHVWIDNMNRFLKYINDSNIKTILDFGTGEAIKLPYILKSKKKLNKLFACDISFNRLSVGYDFLKKKLKKKDLSKISLFCNNDFELPFKNNSIDMIVTSGVFENMSNNKVSKMIFELLRVSKKRLIFIEPKRSNITKKELSRMRKFKLNFNLNKILKKNKINFKEDAWNKEIIHENKTPYSMRIIDKKSKFFNRPNFYPKEEKCNLNSKSNFLYSKNGKLFPILNNIAIFRPLKDLNYFD